jgi:hypothetical protein
MGYLRHRLRVGVAHERVGLAPEWYLGAYNKYLMLLVPKVRELCAGDEEKIRETILALLKIVFFDMGLAIDTYIHAAASACRSSAAPAGTARSFSTATTAILSRPTKSTS